MVTAARLWFPGECVLLDRTYFKHSFRCWLQSWLGFLILLSYYIFHTLVLTWKTCCSLSHLFVFHMYAGTCQDVSDEYAVYLRHYTMQVIFLLFLPILFPCVCVLLICCCWCWFLCCRIGIILTFAPVTAVPVFRGVRSRNRLFCECNIFFWVYFLNVCIKTKWLHKNGKMDWVVS